MITVASYNIRKAIGTDRRRRPERILEVLAEIDADIILLQEADRRFGARQAALPPHLIAEHSGYDPIDFAVRAGGLGWHGNAILVRSGTEVLAQRVLHLPALEPRGAVMADVRIGRHAVRIVGMHLDLSGLWRRRQAHAIIAAIDHEAEKLPTVMAGDLNEWTAARGCLRDFGSHFRFADTGPSFHARRPIARLDRIMVNDKFSVRECGVHASSISRTASDHLPIWAKLDFA
ncbi:endonuclease/exonuclease/phosphatase family metal-dependent hydrolase [Sphingomonas zeicaulis]|uniref:endonuclease/exonuclease/phosphatase family protein n=1 Tax=Sphingomonas zeicaulis TaxID=1632740 RepID=UPI003D1F9D2E